MSDFYDSQYDDMLSLDEMESMEYEDMAEYEAPHTTWNYDADSPWDVD